MHSTTKANLEAIRQRGSSRVFKVSDTHPPVKQKAARQPSSFVGTVLSQSLKWIEKIKPENATCACKSLAKEMNNDGVTKCRERWDNYYSPKMMANKEAITDALKKESNWLWTIGVVGDLIPDWVMVKWLRRQFDQAAEKVATKDQKRLNQKRPGRKRRVQKRRSSNFAGASNVVIPDHPIAFTGDPQLTLLFHVWPHGSGWRRHVEKLAGVVDQFQRLILGVATDASTSTVDEVRAAFGNRWEVVAVTNDRSKKTGLREVATYRKMLPMLSSGVNDVTFCAHAKGAQKHTAQSEPVTWWTDAMYETVLHNTEGVIDHMRNGAAVVGSFRRHGNQLGSLHQWHYSGTFYAFRNCVTFANGIPPYRSHWWGTEAWPGDHFPLGASACIFGDHVGDLYRAENQPREQLEDWKKAQYGTIST